jgi:HlyD family secretion protein
LDIPRPKVRRYNRYVYAALIVVGLGGMTAVLGRLKAAPPTVDRAGLWVDQVKRGPMLREVKGTGRLVPEHVRWITADTAGRVERIHLRPGAAVSADTVLLELANPDVMLQALEAERQVSSAQAELIGLRSTLQKERLAQEGALATLKTQMADARRRSDTEEQMLQRSLTSENEARLAAERAEELTARQRLEEQRLGVISEGQKSQLAAQQAQVDKLNAVAQFRKRLVESMRVQAGGPGVLQELPLELGQWVTPGALLAKVIQPEPLKAELRVPETQARDLFPGQAAQIDTRNGIIPGEVLRVAPAASQGTVLVEVTLKGELPRGARPDMTVEGTVQIERLESILYVGRPAGAQPESSVELFRLGDDGTAVRRKARLGRSSVTTIEVREGLSEGDRVILSDMSALDGAEIVRLR